MTRKQQIQMIRCWLGWSLNVAPELVTDEHVLAWEKLAAEVRSVKPTEPEARGVRAHAKRAGVVPRTSSKPSPKANPWTGPRQKLAGEA